MKANVPIPVQQIWDWKYLSVNKSGQMKKEVVLEEEKQAGVTTQQRDFKVH